jgi:hypothetical protein
MNKPQQGYILLVCLVLLGILAIAALVTTDANVSGQRMTVSAEQKAKSFECAESLRATLSTIWDRAATISDWPVAAGGTMNDEWFGGVSADKLSLKVLGSDVYKEADPRYTSSNDISYKNSKGDTINESLARPVRLRDDAQWVDTSGNIYAKAGVYKSAVNKVAGTAMGQSYGYGSRGYNASNGLHTYYLMRSESTSACSEVAKVIVESDYRWVVR